MNNRVKKFLIFSFILIIVVLVHNMFSVFIENLLGVGDIIFLVATFLLLIGILFYSMTKIIVDKHYSCFILIFAAIITGYLMIYQTLRFVGVNMEYKLNIEDRKKVVQMIETRKIPYNGYDMYVELPKKYWHVSKFSNLVKVDNRDNKLRVAFVVNNGVFKKHFIVIYIAKDGIIGQNDFGEDLTKIKKIENHWYEATADVMM